MEKYKTPREALFGKYQCFLLFGKSHIPSVHIAFQYKSPWKKNYSPSLPNT